MTIGSRIFLNVVATYGRSLIALFCGLFTSRWVLLSLGSADFGLYGLIAGLATVISFFNGVLAYSLARYYAYSVGQAHVSNDQSLGLEVCRRWFSVACLLHAALALILVVLCYPAGCWAINNFLNIPKERIADCRLVFNAVCLSCFVAMISVPFTAMYTAKQNIAELTCYSLISTIINFGFSFWMISHPSDWLVTYAWIMCISSAIPQIMVMLRGFFVYSECRLKLGHAFNLNSIKDLGKFVGWNTFVGLGFMFRNQGVAILVNKYLGSQINASMSVANNVNGQAAQLSNALTGAFMPAITTACGSGDVALMKKMTLKASKFGLLLALVFMIPLGIQIEDVLVLWLKDPPPYCASLCICMMFVLLFDKATIGHGVAIQATGRIVLYQSLFGLSLMLTVPFCLMALIIRADANLVAIIVAVMMFAASFIRVLVAKIVVGVSISEWLNKTILPVGTVAFATAFVSCQFRPLAAPNLFGIGCFSLVVAGLFIILSWFFVLDKEDQNMLTSRVLYARNYLHKKLRG